MMSEPRADYKKKNAVLPTKKHGAENLYRRGF